MDLVCFDGTPVSLRVTAGGSGLAGEKRNVAPGREVREAWLVRFCMRTIVMWYIRGQCVGGGVCLMDGVEGCVGGKEWGWVVDLMGGWVEGWMDVLVVESGGWLSGCVHARMVGA